MHVVRGCWGRWPRSAVRPTLVLESAVRPTPALEKLGSAVRPTLGSSAFVVVGGGNKEEGGGREKAPWVVSEEDPGRPNSGVTTDGAVAPPTPASRRAARRRSSAERPGGTVGVSVIVPCVPAAASAPCRLRSVGEPPRSTPPPPEGGVGSRGGCPTGGVCMARSRCVA